MSMTSDVVKLSSLHTIGVPKVATLKQYFIYDECSTVELDGVKVDDSIHKCNHFGGYY